MCYNLAVDRVAPDKIQRLVSSTTFLISDQIRKRGIIFMQQNIEIWKDVVGYESYYQVSNLGRVKSLDRVVLKNGLSVSLKGCILRPRVSGKGYLSVALQINGMRKNFMVHRLVATAFIENTDNLKEINHIDEIKSNNNAYNLEWCTHKYNSNYGSRGKRISEKLLIKNEKRKKVEMIKDGIVIKTFESITDANNNFVKNGKSIYWCLSGKTKTAYGYFWKYL